jgi:hypothetical protein
MATRILHAPDGTLWEVWDVQPGLQLDSSRRRGPLLPDEMAGGWLCFDSAAEKRRLYPIPAGWEECADGELLQMCRAARPARADRLPSF